MIRLKPALPCPTEHVEAIRLMELVRMHYGKYPELRELFAMPNGGKRSKITGALLKAEGVRKGPSDYILLVPRGPFHGMVLELKRLRGGGLEPEQKDFLETCERRGYYATWARGHAAAFEAFRRYLDGRVDTAPAGMVP